MRTFVPAVRLLIIAVIAFNAVTLVVYFRIQETRLSYAHARAQRELQEASRTYRDLNVQVMERGGRDSVLDRARQVGLELGKSAGVGGTGAPHR